jgi:ABC-2 type transport system permease protein
MTTEPITSVGAGPDAPWEQGDLRPITTGGWRRGFVPLLRKELGQWWGTRQWLIQAVTSLVLINGISGLIMAVDRSEDPMVVFVLAGMITSALAVIVTVQGAVVGEKQRGTAAWVLSKPVSRSSFFLAKLVSYGLGFLSLWLVLPLIVFVLESRFILGETPSLVPLLGAAGLWALHLLVYLSLALALGTFFRSRGPVAAVGIGVILAGQFFGDLVPASITVLLPWVLPDMANGVAHGQELPVSIPTAVVANLVLTAAVTAAALWRLGREEL